MSLIEQIKADLLTARKSRDTIKARLLTVLAGDCMKCGYMVDGVRPPTDSECLAVVKKTVKNLKELTAAKRLRGDETPDEDVELTVLMGYLPKQLSEEHLQSIIEGLVLGDGHRSVGAIMKCLKIHYDGCYDPRRASGIANELISQFGD